MGAEKFEKRMHYASKSNTVETEHLAHEGKGPTTQQGAHL